MSSIVKIWFVNFERVYFLIHVLLAHKTDIVDQNTCKFQVSRVGKYLFKPSTCGARIVVRQTWSKSDSLILNVYNFLIHILLAHKTGIADQILRFQVSRVTKHLFKPNTCDGSRVHIAISQA